MAAEESDVMMLGVEIDGLELWTMSEESLIKDSQRKFQVEEYNRQHEFGIDK